MHLASSFMCSYFQNLGVLGWSLARLVMLSSEAFSCPQLWLSERVALSHQGFLASIHRLSAPFMLSLFVFVSTGCVRLSASHALIQIPFHSQA